VQLVKLRRGSLNQKREGREWAVHKAWLQPQCHRKKKEKGRKKEGGREEGRKEGEKEARRRNLETKGRSCEDTQGEHLSSRARSDISGH
jgi:hypothetical protein